MSIVVLETKNLSHIYSEGTTSRVDAIRDICLKIEKGELVGVIGHTGSGKSTLIQHFNGLLKGSSGVVMLEGKDYNVIEKICDDIINVIRENLC